jgi:predicted nucleotidyltransferase
MTHAISGLKVDLPLDAIESICRKYGVEELSVFGSVLRDDFRVDSDVDFLVRFKNGDAGPWGYKFEELSDELSALLGREVDIVDKSGIEQSENYLRREHVLHSAQVIYVA